MTTPSISTTTTPPPVVSSSRSPTAVDAWTELTRLSQKTNEIQRKLQQAQCNQGVGATDTGSWCQVAVQNQHVTDVAMAAALTELFAGKSVLSLGDGRGEYKAFMLNSSTPVKLSLSTGGPRESRFIPIPSHREVA